MALLDVKGIRISRRAPGSQRQRVPYPRSAYPYTFAALRDVHHLDPVAYNSYASVKGVVVMTEPEPRVGRYAADMDFTTLPEPISLAHTVVEQAAASDVPTGGGWDGAVGGDDGGG